ncbi:Centromeric protein E [Anas platyrhynchos]|uniref:Centromeric protein E n=1 Tax=Anas platyrhynchos TaxID=8839 RepID=R0JGS8_ANAPL|nr:Centromeric protein E [Anas platyrhynchos]
MADEGAVTVCVRLRPLLARESALGDEAAPHWRSEGNTVSEVSGARAFSYDRVFHSSDNTQQLYEGVAVPIIQSAVQGYNENRHYGETKMNEHSSRSHTIFRMIIESRERSDLANANCDGAVMVSHLNLVDLAGSERASQTGSEGEDLLRKIAKVVKCRQLCSDMAFLEQQVQQKL